jgi:hypothetical protein
MGLGSAARVAGLGRDDADVVAIAIAPILR